jgi:hypothetical protein
VPWTSATLSVALNKKRDNVFMWALTAGCPAPNSEAPLAPLTPAPPSG